MRRIIVVSAVVAGLCVGCEQTQPTAGGQETFSVLLRPSTEFQEIIFKNIVADRDNPKRQYNASGKVGYRISPSPILQRDMVKVSITLAGQLESSQIDNAPLPVSGSSVETIAIGKNGSVILEKGYRVAETGMWLVIRYSVTTESLGVKEMWLQSRAL